MTEEKRKPDLILSTGKEIFLNFDAVTYKEMTSIFDAGETREQSDEVISRVCGFPSVNDFTSISANDARRCARKVIKAWLNWQDDPND